ncbi:zinc-dependent metalloprotease [Rapidithrix thailandica]|uniref:Zinc-dependent metalloprotease n=1 Tax=Rapidithrix thailandica TaxID=413964 RepID=A0AAW9SD43_9BACT
MINKLPIFKQLLYSLLLSGFILAQPGDGRAQSKKKKKSKKGETEQVTPPKKPKSTSKIKPYKDIITDKAISDEGMFTVHKVEEKYYFEIPDSLLEREILVISRISGTVQNFNFGGAGMRSRPQQVVRFQKHEEKLLLRSVSFNNVADPDQPIYKSVRNNNFEPIITSFDISALSNDSTGYVVEVSGFFTSDVEMIGPLTSSQRKNFGVKRLDRSRSLVVRMKSFPQNVEVRHILTYDASKPPSNATTQVLSLEMNQSFVLLPKTPMMPRIADERVGYFSIQQYDYGSEEHKAAKRTYITRWKLEPKDREAFKRGELVEPVKPIVYYIDPATPEKWRPYLKKGIEDWQTAFEAAGFKNAILAKDPPSKEEDPEFDPEDVRYSVIRYVTNPIQNAMGPHVHDPRSGEIIESDIIWYHNVMNLLRNWFFVQTAAINPEARKTKFSDELMGQLIRFVSSHEVGHTLGLPHNMGASSSYQVDSLRSASFTHKMGTAPSIMDYARFNYIAQPEDKGVALYPKIGVYDMHSIYWGYRPILEANSPEEEKVTLHAWIRKHENDPMYRFAQQTARPIDPSAQTEDLGDDAVKASSYGIANLKRIVPNLIEWTAEDGKDYEDLQELYSNVIGQWNRYMGHVGANIGGIYEYDKTYDQAGAVYVHVSKEKQKEALNFLIEQAFVTPEWMINTEILNRIEDAGIVNRIRSAQVRVLSNVLDFSRLARMIENETLNDDKAYSVLEMMDDLREGVWSETQRGHKVDTYRRNLQRAYIESLEVLVKKEQNSVPSAYASMYGHTSVDVSQSDIRPIARGELKKLQSLVKRGYTLSRDELTKYHYDELLARIEQMLEPK